MRRVALSVLVALCGLALCFAQPPAPASPLVPYSVEAITGTSSFKVSYIVNVTLAYGAPSCFARPVALVNGIFEPAITINQGDVLKITLINNLPATFPSVTDGISIHYHGLHMPGPAAFFDGTSYVTLCPVGSGKNYTYEFLVADPPGTYLWHDHSAGLKGDGLQGPLIVLPPRTPGGPPAIPLLAPAQPDLWSYDGEYTLFLEDWYHATTNSLLFQLNMPFDAARVTNDTGAWSWIGNPQAVLINGHGFYGDCQLFAGSGANAVPPTCTPTTFTVPAGRSAAQPWASNNNPGCSHSSFTVDAGKTYRLRLINAATLVYMSLCFEGHNVTLIAADGVPTAPYSTQCVDINSGQRLDVLLTADQPPANYWITAAPQFRVGSPSGYAVINYRGAASPTAFPLSPAPQPVNITPWGYAEDSIIHMSPVLLSPSTNAAAAFYLPPDASTLAPPPSPTKVVLINFSQPLLQATGQIRWALNNVAMAKSPPCISLLQRLRKDPRYLKRMAVNDSAVNGTGGGPYVGVNYVKGEDKQPVFYSDISPVPVYPSVGLHIVENEGGEVVDLIVNNNPANSFNGDYRPNGATRTAMEQHPMHLHGHRFWVLARGPGIFNASLHASSLNTANPSLRDTVTVPAGGWAYLRFVANNPGIWPFHCHILPHVFMGQQLYFVEDIGNAAPAPAKVPSCPATCKYNFAPFNKAFLRDKWGASGWELPPLY